MKISHSLLWIFEPLEVQSEFFYQRMFGCLAGYLENRLVLVVADKQEPWNGLLLPTEREFQPLIQAEFKTLKPHPILGKWLYLSQTAPEFEEVAIQIVEAIQKRDFRMGVDSRPKTFALKKRKKR